MTLAPAHPCRAQAGVPVVHAFTPHEGPPGTVIKIAGEHLDQVLWVEFAGGVLTDFRLFTTSMLKVDVPEGARTGSILLRTENGGAWSPSSFRVITPPVGGLELGRPYPNPGAGPFHIAFNLPAARRVRVDVLDLSGRRVRRLVDDVRDAGPQQTVWDGRDGAGRRATQGLYLIQLRLNDGIETRPLIVLD
jgi:hypothetical protein